MMKTFSIFCPDAAQIVSRNNRKMQFNAIFHILLMPNPNPNRVKFKYICRLFRIALFFLLNIQIPSKVMPIDRYNVTHFSYKIKTGVNFQSKE